MKDISAIMGQKQEVSENLVNEWLPKDTKVKEEINKLLTWEYSNKFATTLESKTSVTKIKQAKMGPQAAEVVLPKPKFLTKTEKLTSAEKGTLVHLCMQKLDFSKQNTMEDIDELINKLVQDEIITQNEADQIDKNVVYKFAQSSIAKELMKARKIYKEAPFYINIPAKEIYKVETDEQILVQGIIDLYYENEQGEIILLDYKTDRVQQANELKEKYKIQLEIYKKALEASTGKLVAAVYIYSTCLNEAIKVE